VLATAARQRNAMHVEYPAVYFGASFVRNENDAIMPPTVDSRIRF
jgi:hypothetical protein